MSSILTAIIAGQLRHVLTALAGALVAAGAIDAAQTESFVAITSGLVLYVLGAAWSWWQKRRTLAAPSASAPSAPAPKGP